MQPTPRPIAASPPRRDAKTYQKPRSGDVIDQRFQIVGRPLGKGGMGTVYRVRDPHGNEYALKRLDPALREEKRFEQRFRLEYEAAAHLKHPNITGYLELFEAHGALHILMELVDGVNLRPLMKEQKLLPLSVSVGIARSLARALEHLHAHRVVHRDLKPENILVGLDGSIKLTDFGISRVEYAGITRTGTLLGTPRYMSPEQLAGKKGEHIGPESDIYALGILLYELLTGKDPYRLRKKAEVLEVMHVRHHQDPRPLPKEIDPDLGKLVLMMLERDPQKRLSDARWIGQELGRWAASRGDLKHALRLATEQLHEASGTALQPLIAAKPSAESAQRPLEEPATTHDPQEGFAEPTQGHELLPALILTFSFLLVLWGLGWLAHQPSSPSQDMKVAKQSTVEPQPHEMPSALGAPVAKETKGAVAPLSSNETAGQPSRASLEKRPKKARREARKKKRHILRRQKKKKIQQRKQRVRP